MKSSIKYAKDRPWLLALIIVVAVAFPGFLRVEYVNDKTDSVVACVTDWADASVKRSNRLTEANARRQDALDELIRSVPTQNREIFQGKLNHYIDVSDEYNNILKENPIPESPKLVC